MVCGLTIIMQIKIYNKLIRDKIPEIITASGSIAKVSVLNDIEYRTSLKIKMGEEAKELIEAETIDDVLNELSDVEELIRAIAKNYNLSLGEIEKHRAEKLQKRGGFEKKLFLESVEEK